MTLDRRSLGHVLVLGGRGPAALERTLSTLPHAPEDVLCAVADPSETERCAGFARIRMIAPWPGQRRALGVLLDEVVFRDEERIQILTAGSGFDQELLTACAGRTDVVLPTAHRGPLRSGLLLRRLQHAEIAPASGLTTNGVALRRLHAAGWFSGTDLTLAQVRDLAGSVLVRRVRDPLPMLDLADRPETQRLTVTVVVPAHNEESCIGDTLRSIAAQTRMPDEVLVIDDGSSDRTGEIAAALGARVFRTPGTGCKGSAVNAALDAITTDALVLVDADTLLHPEAVAHVVADLEAGNDATHGAVLPSHARGLWARGRTIEYGAAIRLQKKAQVALGRVMVLSGCALGIRLEALRAVGGFQDRTMVEDLDLTWTLHQHGFRVGYASRAVAYPLEPGNRHQYTAQMRRWTRGFFQAIRVHADTVHHTPSLAFLIVASLWDMLTSPLIALVLVALAVSGNAPTELVTTFALWSIGWTLVAAMLAATVVGWRRAARCAPSYAVLSTVSGYFSLESFFKEWILRRRLTTWVKGH